MLLKVGGQVGGMHCAKCRNTAGRKATQIPNVAVFQGFVTKQVDKMVAMSRWGNKSVE